MADSVEFKGMAAHKVGVDLAPFSYKPRAMGDYDVDIDVEYCGICHSDIHAIAGHWGKRTYPIIPGHEVVGVVRRVGAKVTRHKVGDSVGSGPVTLSCLKDNCHECSTNNHGYCPDAKFLYDANPYPGSDVLIHGGYADGIRVHEEFVVSFPESLDKGKCAPLLCAGITVYKPLVDFGCGPGKRVGIVGIGGLGHLAIMFAAKMGAEVHAISRGMSKAGEATKLGAKGLIATSEEEGRESAFKTHAGYFDLIIVTASGELPYHKYLRMLRSNATLVFLGFEGKMELSPMALVMKGQRVVGSLVGSPKETEDMLKFAAEHNVVPWSTVFPLADADEAVKAVQSGKPRYRYVLQCRI